MQRTVTIDFGEAEKSVCKYTGLLALIYIIGLTEEAIGVKCTT